MHVSSSHDMLRQGTRMLQLINPIRTRGFSGGRETPGEGSGSYYAATVASAERRQAAVKQASSFAGAFSLQTDI